jgi:hypothetical protein
MTKWAARKRAQRKMPMTECHWCGGTLRLQHHHHDYDKPMDCTVLCQTCHARLHYATGTWGKGRRAVNA